MPAKFRKFVKVIKIGHRCENFFEALNRNLLADGSVALAVAGANLYLGNWANSANMVESIIPNAALNVLATAGVYIGIPVTVDGILYSSCDEPKGAFHRSDIFRVYKKVGGIFD